MTPEQQTPASVVTDLQTAIFSVSSGVGYNNLGDVIRAGLRALSYDGPLQRQTEQIVSRIAALTQGESRQTRWQDIATLTQTGFATPLVDVWAIGPGKDGPDEQYRIADCWRREDGVWFSMRFGKLKQSRITHFMPLPAAPTPADGGGE